jgi:hypothetical protein
MTKHAMAVLGAGGLPPGIGGSTALPGWNDRDQLHGIEERSHHLAPARPLGGHEYRVEAHAEPYGCVGPETR